MFSFVAVMLYLLAAGGFSAGISHRIQVDQSIATTGTGILVAEQLPYASGFAVKEGTSLWSAGNANQGSYKQPQLFKAIIGALEVQVSCAITQSVAQLFNHPLRIRKADMLFPFHYFFETQRA